MKNRITRSITTITGNKNPIRIIQDRYPNLFFDSSTTSFSEAKLIADSRESEQNNITMYIFHNPNYGKYYLYYGYK